MGSFIFLTGLCYNLPLTLNLRACNTKGHFKGSPAFQKYSLSLHGDAVRFFFPDRLDQFDVLTL